MEENCHVEPIEKETSAEEHLTAETILLAVSGMGCINCANRVRNSLLSVNGVVFAYVDHTAGMAQVAFHHDQASTGDLIAAVARAGSDGRHEYGASLLLPR